MPVKRKPDYLIVVCVMTLLAIGIIMIFSSSAVLAAQKFNDPYYFLKRQTVWATIGSVFMFMAMRWDYRKLRDLGPYIYIVILLSLTLVLLPGIGKNVNGAQRWINLGFVTFQPSEFAKLGLVIFFSAFLAKKAEDGRLKEFMFGYVPSMVFLGAAMALIQLQPDMGTSVIIGIVTFTLFLISGIRIPYLMGTVLLALPVLWAAVHNVGYRRRRLLSFMNPWDDAGDAGYQIIQSFVAFASGGLWGTGLGNGKQKLFFLPEPHTDFIFSIISEELGFIGAMGVVALFIILSWRGLRTGMRAPDKFGAYLAMGITLFISIQAVINMSVAMGLVPTKGLPLPFISLGGSALVMWLISVGLLANVSGHTT